MKTIKEMIEVMKAYEEGKTIEHKTKDGDKWFEVIAPSWNWWSYDYRVKEEPKYIPYKDTEEMINDFCERFGVKRTNFGEPFIWVKNKNKDTRKYLIDKFDSNSVTLGSYTDFHRLSELFDNFTYLDDSPCGKLEN